MKPSSIIFLIVSVAVIVAGLVLCTAGINMAREQDIALFETDVIVEDGDVVRTEVFDTEITKVKMNLTDVSVTVKPSKTGETYLELRNFRLGTFDASVQNKILIIDNSTSLFSLMHIAEGSFNFRGLRHYLTDKTSTNTEKSVCLYLAPETELKSLDITASSGYMNIEGFTTNTDYNVSVVNGSVRLADLQTRSNTSISTDNGYVVYNSVRSNKVNVVIGNGGFDGYFIMVPSESNITVQNGDIYCAFKQKSLYGIQLNLDASGSIYHAGEEKENIRPMVLQEGPGTPQNLKAEFGDIYTNLEVTDITHIFDDQLEIIPGREEQENGKKK
ncbi:MAG: DUF4097 domain-containing protein [Clostridia bacterium]|nr:DUF4097 domain-containing protein [Clostridia bacterium]